MLLAFVIFGVTATFYLHRKPEQFVGTSVGGVHHMGSRYAIYEFFVDGSWGSNVGREGGGGSLVCCVAIPKKWRPGMTADIRWDVLHLPDDAPLEHDPSKARNVESAGMYRATVPVERYGQPGKLWVHFFPDGRVRVVVSNVGPEGAKHPIRDIDPGEARSATKGIPVSELFTKEEIAATGRKTEKEKNIFGDWR